MAESEREQSRRVALRDETKHVERLAWAWSALFRQEARWWRRLNLLLTVFAATLAAASASAGLAALTTQRVAGLIALAASIVSAIAAALGGSNRASVAQAAATANMTLSDSARAFHRTTAPFAPMDEVMTSFQELCQRRDQVVASSPGNHLPWTVYRYRKLMEMRESQDK